MIMFATAVRNPRYWQDYEETERLNRQLRRGEKKPKHKSLRFLVSLLRKQKDN